MAPYVCAWIEVILYVELMSIKIDVDENRIAHVVVHHLNQGIYIEYS